ncbi:MAG: ABC transporter substrate-binding protein [Eggerthellales bacterium]|nr:ABC transporter substrate-binding protein [Eggerthellales bacterium]
MRAQLAKLAALALSCVALVAALTGCSSTPTQEGFHRTDLGNGWKVQRSLELHYAQGFTVDYFQDGYKLVCIEGNQRFLVVPEGAQVPAKLPADVQVLQQPLNNLYLVATDSFCLFDALDALDTVALSGVAAKDLSVENAASLIREGKIAYGGKYREPDYELILSKNAPLAIESTMIDHSPSVKERLSDLGIAVLVEQSSYEPEPLGRTEWIKLYGALLNKEDVAEAVFSQQEALVKAVASEQATDKTVAFFYINSNGAAVVRKPGDYVTRMIEMAGGSYIFSDLGANDAMSTVTMEMETFYAQAKDADIIIYNASIDGGVKSTQELVTKNALLSEFKAVNSGNVWCTDKNMYQQMVQTGTIVSNLHTIFTDANATTLDFAYKLN